MLFGLMAWHPQWLLMGVLFWTVSTCINKYCDTFFWLDMLEIAVFYLLIVVKFAGIDQNMLSHGILHKWLYQKDLNESVAMRHIFHVENVDESIL